jgi:3-keto-5-aminohexanoate cleavage enzyme
MKTIISVALTGAVSSKAKNPNIPCTPKEIAEDAIKCWKAGAAIAHLHMRDDEFRGTMDKERFQETVKRIRGESDVVLNLTSSGEINVPFERRMEHIADIKPEIATFDAGSINVLPDGIFDNTVSFLTKLGGIMNENNVKPEVEIMDLGMIAAAEYYLHKGVLKAPVHFQFVLGFFSGAPATPENLAYLRGKIPQGSTWSAFGIGPAHMPILYTAIAMGGHVRVGLEDNLFYGPGRLATNLDLVERAARVIREFGNEVANPADARSILGLRGVQGENIPELAGLVSSR